MRYNLGLLFISNATSCAIGSGVREMSYNGENIYEAKCNGTFRTMTDCMAQASQKCSEFGKKSKIINTDESSAAAGNYKGFATSINRSLLFKCD